MRIGLVNIDSTYTNIALEKLRMFYKQRGDDVYDIKTYHPGVMDVIYASTIFKRSFPAAHEWALRGAIVGGTGWDLTVRLPDAVDAMKPKINIGFTTRGCFRRCGFCVVPQKEGRLHVTGDIHDFWDGKAKDIIILDNNILGVPAHFKKIIQQCVAAGVRPDFNQGLDARLITQDTINTLLQARPRRVRFAFDNTADKPVINRAVRLCVRNKLNTLWYVYAGGDYDDVMQRLLYLKKYGQRCWLMRDDAVKYPLSPFNNLSRWVNQPRFFMGLTYEEFLKKDAAYNRARRSKNQK